MVLSLYLAEPNMWIRLSLLHQPGLGLPLISVDDQNRTISVNTIQNQGGLRPGMFHQIVPSVITFLHLSYYCVYNGVMAANKRQSLPKLWWVLLNHPGNIKAVVKL